MAVQGSENGVAAVISVDDETKLYFYGECDEEYCGTGTEADTWNELETNSSTSQLENVAQIDLNSNELVIRFMSG